MRQLVPRIRFALLIAALLLAQPVVAANNLWQADELEVQIGSASTEGEALILSPTARGQALVRLPAGGLSLEHNYRLHVEFSSPRPQQVFIVWRNDRAQEEFQFPILPTGHPHITIDMRGVKGWEGNAVVVELGFLVPPGGSVGLNSVQLGTPSLVHRVSDTLNNWTSYRPWKPADINIYTGVADYRSTMAPVPFFAASCALALGLYLLVRRRRASWHVVMAIVLAHWLVLDAFWQLRLWRQVEQTREQFAGQSSSEKVRNTQEAPLAALAEKVKQRVDPDNARVFVISTSDFAGMNSNYYLAPVNTLWERRHTRLPKPIELHPGDYILLINPHELNYDANAGLLHYRKSATVAVSPLFADRYGTLLKVI